MSKPYRKTSIIRDSQILILDDYGLSRLGKQLFIEMVEKAAAEYPNVPTQQLIIEQLESQKRHLAQMHWSDMNSGDKEADSTYLLMLAGTLDAAREMLESPES